MSNAYSKDMRFIYGIYDFDGKNIGKIISYCIYGLKTYLIKTFENKLQMYYLEDNKFIFLKNIFFDNTKKSIYSINKYDFEPEIIHLLRYYIIL